MLAAAVLDGPGLSYQHRRYSSRYLPHKVVLMLCHKLLWLHRYLIDASEVVLGRSYAGARRGYQADLLPGRLSASLWC